MSRMKRRVAFAMALTMLLTSLPSNGLIGYAEEYPDEVTEVVAVDDEATEVVEEETTDEAFLEEDEDIISSDEDSGVEEEQIMGEEPVATYSEDGDVASDLSNGVEEHEVSSTLTVEGQLGTDIKVKPNGNVRLSVVAHSSLGDEKITYKWNRSIDVSGETIEGANEAVLSVEQVNTRVRYACTISDGNETVYREFYISVDTGLTFEAENPYLQVKYGKVATLKVNAQADDGIELKYQWQIESDGNNYTDIEGAVENTYQIASAEKSANYRCVINDGYQDNYQYIYLNVQTLQIENDWNARNLNVEYGADAKLGVVAHSVLGDDKLTYEWRKRKADNTGYDTVENETSSELQLKNITGKEEYDCWVKDGNDQQCVTFYVLVDTGVVFNDNIETSFTVKKGDSVHMDGTASAKEGVTLTYQWEILDREKNEYVAIQDEQNETYDVTVGDYSERYRCAVTDHLGQKFYRYFYVTIPTLHVNVEKKEYDVEYDGNVSLSLTATSDLGDITYKWHEINENGNWSELISNTDTLAVNNITQAKNYVCEVSDSNETHTVYFNVNINAGFVFNKLQEEFYGAPGEKITLDASAKANDGIELQYKWYRDYDGEYNLIEKATSDTLEAEILEEYSRYVCVVTDSYKNQYRKEFRLYPDTSIEIDSYWEEDSVELGDNVTLYVDAISNAGTLTYKWYIYDKDDKMQIIEGAKDKTYELKEVKENSHYACEVSNGYQEETKTVDFYVYVESGLHINYDESNYAKLGESVELYVEAESKLGTLSYRWLKYNEEEDKYDIIEEAENKNNYIVNNVQKNESYQCIVSNEYEEERAYFEVYVDSGFGAEDNNEHTVYVKKGQRAQLTANAWSDYPLTYEWYKVGEEEEVLIEGEVDQVYLTQQIEENEHYHCRVSDGYNSTSICFDIRIDTGFSATAEAYVSADANGKAELKVNATTDLEYGPLEYEWSVWEDKEWKTLEGVTIDTYILENVTSMQMYRCSVSNQKESKNLYIIAGPESEKDKYAFDFASARELSENDENEVEIPVNRAKIYFKFKPNRSGIWKIYSESEDDTKAYLYNSDQEYLEENDDDGEGRNFSLEYGFVKGKTYYLACGYYESGIGSFIVKAEFVRVDKGDHNWDEGTITQQPTCVDHGIMTYVCEDCGETYTEEIDALGHEYPEKWTTRKEATCTEEGVEYRICTRDGIEETRTIPIKEHEFGEVITVQPDETKNGKTYQICKNCQYEKISKILPATGVSDDVKTAKEAVDKITKEESTVKEIGDAVDAITKIDNQLILDMDEADEESNLAGLVSEVEEKLIGKNLTDAGIAGTIENSSVVTGDGNVSDGVKVEGAAVTVASLLKKNEITGKKDATYQAQLKISENPDSQPENGVYSVNISMDIMETADGNTTPAKSDVQPAAPIRITMPIPENFKNAKFVLMHNKTEVSYTISEDGKSIIFYAASFSPWELQITRCAEDKHQYNEATDDPAWVNATHTTTGYKVKICSICNDRQESIVPTTPHEWGDWKQTKEATCMQNGEKERNCTIDGCEEKETQIIAKNGHRNEEVIDLEPTCGKAGSKHYKCSVCDIETSSVEIPATRSHKMVKVVDQEATCVTDGAQHYECTVCHTKDQKSVIKAFGSHNMQLVVDQNPTCGAAGSQHYECTVCHTKEAVTAIHATGAHNYGNYRITTQPTVLAEGVQTRTCTVCGYTENSAVAKLAANVTLSASTIPLQVKQSVALSKLITAMTTGDRLVSCTTSNKKIATVNNAGKVTGKKAGKAKITMNFASGLSKMVTVKVQKAKVATSKITNIPGSITLKVKKTYKLSPVIAPITTKDKASYKSANKKVATVAKNGKITAKKAGKTTITVKVGKKTKKVKVTVTK